MFRGGDLAVRGCNTHAAAEYTNLQSGEVGTQVTQIAEWFSRLLT